MFLSLKPAIHSVICCATCRATPMLRDMLPMCMVKCYLLLVLRDMFHNIGHALFWGNMLQNIRYHFWVFASLSQWDCRDFIVGTHVVGREVDKMYMYMYMYMYPDPTWILRSTYEVKDGRFIWLDSAKNRATAHVNNASSIAPSSTWSAMLNLYMERAGSGQWSSHGHPMAWRGNTQNTQNILLVSPNVSETCYDVYGDRVSETCCATCSWNMLRDIVAQHVTLCMAGFMTAFNVTQIVLSWRK